MILTLYGLDFLSNARYRLEGLVPLCLQNHPVHLVVHLVAIGCLGLRVGAVLEGLVCDDEVKCVEHVH